MKATRWSVAGVIAAAVAITGCAAAGAGAIAGATTTAAIATGVGAYRMSEGECFTVCARGTTCNRKTGYCDPLPCHGMCRDEERCDDSGLIPKCVPDSSKIFMASGDAGTPGFSTSPVP